MSRIKETNNKITKENVENLTEDLEIYQTQFQSYFKRKEHKQHANNYLGGLLYPLPNKSIETMMLQMKGDDANAIRAMQHFVSEGAWNDAEVLAKHRQLVESEIGEADGVIIVDGSGFPKQGSESVGVKRQWCGQLGKVANCQVGVFLGYASQQGRTLLDYRLYLPQEWVEAKAYAKRRKRCGVPQDVTFKTKPELAAEMVLTVAESNALQFKWLTADEAFGRNSEFLDEVGKVVWYFAEVPHDTYLWHKRPKTELPAWSGKGRKPTLHQLVAGEPKAQTVVEIGASLADQDWSRHLIKEGSKGPIVADMAAVRVVNSRQQLPGDTVWLVFRRNILTGEIKYFLSNAPDHILMDSFARISGLRWPIETCFEEGKQELGMGDYQVRTWTGWHHHMTFVVLAHGFLMKIQHKLANDAPKLTLPQVILLLKSVLPQPKFDLESTVRIVNYYQHRHEAARLSHRKRRLALIHQLE